MVTTRGAAHSDANDDAKISESQTSRKNTSRKQTKAQKTHPTQPPSQKATSTRVTRNASSQKPDDVPDNTQSELSDGKKKTASRAASGANTLTRKQSAAAKKEQATSEDTVSKRAASKRDVAKSEDTKSKDQKPTQEVPTTLRTNTLTRSQRAAAKNKAVEPPPTRKSSVRSNAVVAKAESTHTQRPASSEKQPQQRRTSSRITALVRDQESQNSKTDAEAALEDEVTKKGDEIESVENTKRSENKTHKTKTATTSNDAGKSVKSRAVKTRHVVSKDKSQPASSARMKSTRSTSQPLAAKKVAQTSRKPGATTSLGKRKEVDKTSSSVRVRASKRLKTSDGNAPVAEDLETEAGKVDQSSRKTPSKSRKSVSPVKRQTESPLSDLTSAPTTPSDIVMPDLDDVVEENGNKSDRESSDEEDEVDQDELDRSAPRHSKYNLDDSEDELAGPKTPMRRSAAPPRRLNKSPMTMLGKRRLRSEKPAEIQEEDDTVTKTTGPLAGIGTSQDSITIQGDEPETMSTLRETQTEQQGSDKLWHKEDQDTLEINEESNPFSLSVMSNSEHLFGVPVEMGDPNETIIDIDDHLTSSPSSDNSVIITRREQSPHNEDMKDGENAEDEENVEDDYDEDYPRLSMTAKTPRPQTIDWNTVENEDDADAGDVGIMSDILSSPTKRKIEEAVREEVENGVDESLEFSEFVSMPAADNAGIDVDEAPETPVVGDQLEIAGTDIEPKSEITIGNDHLAIEVEIEDDAKSEEQADVIVQADAMQADEHAESVSQTDDQEEHAESISQADEDSNVFKEQNAVQFVEELYENAISDQLMPIKQQIIVDHSDVDAKELDHEQISFTPHTEQDTAQYTLDDPFAASADDSQAAAQIVEQQRLAFDDVLADEQKLIASNEAAHDVATEREPQIAGSYGDDIDDNEQISAEVDNAQSQIDHIPPSIASIFARTATEQDQPSQEQTSQESSHEVAPVEQIPHYMQSTISFRRKSLPSAAHLYTPLKSGVRPKTSTGADLGPAIQSYNEPWWVRARSQSRASTVVTTPAVSPAKSTRVFAPFAVATPRHKINQTAVQSARAAIQSKQDIQQAKHDYPQIVAATRLKRLPTSPNKSSPARRLLPTTSTPRRTPLKSITSSIAFPTMTPHPAIPLRGIVAIVEVYTLEGSCASAQFVTALTRLGAKTTKIWSDRVTHVIFKDGPPSVLQKVANHNKRVAASGVGNVIHCVCSRWISDCDTAGTRLDETDETYAVDTSFVPTSNKRKRKSMEPATIVNIGGSLKKDRKSSWGRSTSSLFSSNSSRENSISATTAFAARDGGKENLDSASPATPTWLRAPEELTPTTAPVKRVRRLEPVGFDRFKARRRTLLNHF